MRLFLAALVIIIGANIGLNAINNVKQMQDNKIQKYCMVDPTFHPDCKQQ
jgi:hypothetical protein